MASIANRVEAETETELSRLASEKLLLAATQANIAADRIAEVLASMFNTGAKRLESWAEAADDEAVATTLSDAADHYATLHKIILDEWPEATDEAETLLDLGDPDGEWQQVGAGLVGLPFVLDRHLLQAVSYHVNQANTAAADQFRKLREEVEAIEDQAGNVLSNSDEMSDAVVAGAIGVVEASYDQYVSRLQTMGMDPKPLC